jgi:predicted AAA+ superfamily ATPase
MIQREIAPVLRSLFEKYPVVTVTGPRQSGKTTLCRATFPDLEYVNLERPDTRSFALEDPLGFLGRLKNGAVIDEIQRAPDLVSYIQVQVDEESRNGVFVLTGSRQFEVSEAISQSLAGRTGLLRLLPFTISELERIRPGLDIDSLIYGGFYPRIYDQDIEPIQALGDYFETYVERDVRQIGEIRQLTEFQRFVRLCAGRTGQLLNLQSLGNDAGVSHTTARRWMSILEASYILFRLQPFHANMNKRLIKAPKMYFYDVGLAAYLMGIENASQILSHPLRGHLFENLVVVEALKYRFNRGKRSNLLFFRDSSGFEVDLLCTQGMRFAAVEIKAAQTICRSFFSNLKKLRRLMPDRVAEEVLVHGGPAEYIREGVKVTGPVGLAGLLAEWEAEEKAGGFSR